MNNRWLAAFRQRDFWIYSAWAIGGAILIYISGIALVYALTHIAALSFLSVIIALFAVFFLSIGTTCFFMFLRRSFPGLLLLNIMLLPAEGVLWALKTFKIAAAPFYALILAFVAPISIWTAILYSGLVSQVNAKYLFYTTLLACLLLFTYGSRWMVQTYLTWQLSSYEGVKDFSSIVSVLHFEHVRYFVYAVLMIVTIVGNTEKFAGFEIAPMSVWSVYKDMLLEVLISFTVCDFLLYEKLKKSKP